MPYKAAISKSYQRFSSAEGNQHIASEYALLKLQELIRKFEIENVLEVGLGIGSIAGTLLALNPKLNYTGTEANSFCLKRLSKNLLMNYQNLEIFNKLRDIPSGSLFDLIIIDGKDSELEVVKRLLNKRGVIAIEGDRMPQEDKLRKLYPRHTFVHCISSKRNAEYSPFPSANWQGGLKIIFTDPGLKQELWRKKEKVNTKFKYLFMR